jgi:condensin complex subunit 1
MFHLAEELQTLASGDLSVYHIPNHVDPTDPDVDVSGALERAVDAVANSSESITQPEIFDVYRSLLK